jgi:hypothetical protein
MACSYLRIFRPRRRLGHQGCYQYLKSRYQEGLYDMSAEYFFLWSLGSQRLAMRIRFPYGSEDTLVFSFSQFTGDEALFTIANPYILRLLKEELGVFRMLCKSMICGQH